MLYHAPKLEPTVHFASAPQTAPKQQNSPSNVPLNVTDLANADATTLTPVCFGHHGATQSVPMLVGELSVTFLVTPHTLFGGLASNARPMGVGSRNVTPISVLGPTTLTTVVLYPHGTPRAVGTQGALVHTTQGGICYAAYYDQGANTPFSPC